MVGYRLALLLDLTLPSFEVWRGAIQLRAVCGVRNLYLRAELPGRAHDPPHRAGRQDTHPPGRRIRQHMLTPVRTSPVELGLRYRRRERDGRPGRGKLQRHIPRRVLLTHGRWPRVRLSHVAMVLVVIVVRPVRQLTGTP